MMNLAEAAIAVEGKVNGARIVFTGVTTDSRAVQKADLFVAIQGERFDGHAYVREAFEKGAAAAMTMRFVDAIPPIPQVVVDDTRFALGRLAASWRNQFALPLLAITGSSGKTTVKEMLRAILAAHCGDRGAVLATEGNLNNDIGMPLTLLRLRESHRFAVVEMGMNHPGEIDYLTRLASPTATMVTNVQRAHIGMLGSLDSIARAKGEIYAGLGDGLALVNEDEPFAAYWKDLNLGRRIITFGFSESAEVRGHYADGTLQVETLSERYQVRLRVPGEHNARNALAACAAACALNVPAVDVWTGLASFGGVSGRLEYRAGRQDARLIDDTYNANPESMKAALRVLAAEKGHRVFVMGDMGELGDDGPSMHHEVGGFARDQGIEVLLAYGEGSRHAVEAFGHGGRHFDELAALVDAAAAEAGAGVTILVKGSRFMRMERVVDALLAERAFDAA